jgi:hypothetical protein
LKNGEIVTNNERIQAVRQAMLVPIMARHRHACLTYAQQAGCPRTQCFLNMPENELVRKFLQHYGEMPGGGEDDLEPIRLQRSLLTAWHKDLIVAG